MTKTWMLGAGLAIGLAGGAVACGGPGDGSEPGSAIDPSPDPAPDSSGESPPGTPIDPPAPIAHAKAFERVPGTSLRGLLDAQNASTFDIVTPPKHGSVGWIDASKGEFLYRPDSVTRATADEFEFVAKGGGRVSPVAKVTISVKPLDFSGPMDVRGAVERWYSYNLAVDFNNSGTSDCGPQQISVTAGKLLERAWSCGTYPEIAVSVGAAGIYGYTSSGGGTFRKVEILRRQLDARLEYHEQSTDCSSYNSTLNACNAGLSEDTTGRLYLGTAPTTTTAPVVLPTTCETTAGKVCKGFLLASDAEADLLTFIVQQKPQNGSVTLDPELKGFSYTPKPGFVGTDTFTVVADDTPNDFGGESAPATITVVVH